MISHVQLTSEIFACCGVVIPNDASIFKNFIALFSAFVFLSMLRILHATFRNARFPVQPVMLLIR
jgi:hypothetical protein